MIILMNIYYDKMIARYLSEQTPQVLFVEHSIHNHQHLFFAQLKLESSSEREFQLNSNFKSYKYTSVTIRSNDSGY